MSDGRPRRFVTLERATFDVDRIFAYRVERSYSMNAADERYITSVWLKDMPHPFTVDGDHAAALKEATGGIYYER